MQRLLVIAEDAEAARLVRQLAFAASGKIVPVDYTPDSRLGLLMALDGIHSLVVLGSRLEPLSWQEVLQEIRDQYRTKDLPVFVLLEQGEPGSDSLGFPPGETWFLRQPCDSRHLSAALATVLLGCRVAGTSSPSPAGDSFSGLHPLGE